MDSKQALRIRKRLHNQKSMANQMQRMNSSIFMICPLCLIPEFSHCYLFLNKDLTGLLPQAFGALKEAVNLVRLKASLPEQCKLLLKLSQ